MITCWCGGCARSAPGYTRIAWYAGARVEGDGDASRPAQRGRVASARCPSRARFAIRDVGQFDVALFTMEAPATVLDSRSSSRPGITTGSRSTGRAQRRRPGWEPGREPGTAAMLRHARRGRSLAARSRFAGISTRGHDTGDAQIFVDLVDNPRYDHTVHRLRPGAQRHDIVDRLLEGDVIERRDPAVKFSIGCPPTSRRTASRDARGMKHDGVRYIDLTASNPTRAGFDYPDDLLAPLADPRGLSYRPEPLGALEARSAVAADFARRGIDANPRPIALTASTSEAYSLLFKLLCDPGDEVLIPQPSYPLFEHLTRLDAVTAVPYHLEYHGRWSVDIGSVERALTPRTRALLVVNPNNPTGNFVSAAELDALVALCGPRDIAVISDEVFADYELQNLASAPRGLADRAHRGSGFTLGGLSKSVGLPQAKLGWIAVSGSDTIVDDALPRLELTCDTYLSVSTPVQLAAREILERGAVRAQANPGTCAGEPCGVQPPRHAAARVHDAVCRGWMVRRDSGSVAGT